MHGFKAEKSKVMQPDGNSSEKSMLKKIKNQYEKSKVNVNCVITNTKSDVISMCVVPVLVQHKLSNCIVKTYAMLDNCS